MNNKVANGIEFVKDLVKDFLWPIKPETDQWAKEGVHRYLLPGLIYLGLAIPPLSVLVVTASSLQKEAVIEEIQENLSAIPEDNKADLLRFVQAKKNEQLVQMLLEQPPAANKSVNEGN